MRRRNIVRLAFLLHYQQSSGGNEEWGYDMKKMNWELLREMKRIAKRSHRLDEFLTQLKEAGKVSESDIIMEIRKLSKFGKLARP
jgi:hypothetical protein